MLFKNLFDKKKLINWKKPDIIELYRYNIEQNIIDNFGDSTFTCFDKNYEINNQEIKENKIIINIESGYSKWLTKFIEKFDNIKIKKIKMPLYKEDIFNGICIENVILGYSQFKDNILKMLKTTYNIVLNYDELKDILIYEWEKEKSYIEFYIICGNKGGFVST